MRIESKQDMREMGPGARFFFKRIFPVIFVIVGIAVSFGMFKAVEMAQDSRSWPQSEGVVKISEVVLRNRSEGKSMYRAEIMYEYQVDGKTYCSNRVSSIKSSSSNPTSARKAVDKYPEGAKVKVFYKPDDPQRSLLEPGVSPVMWLRLLIGPLFTVVGVGMLFLMPRLLGDRTPKTKNEYRDLPA